MMDSLPIEQQAIRANGVAYQVEWYGEKRPILFLHGFTGSCHNWRPHWPTFANQLQAIGVDLLGHGQTDSPPTPTRYQMPQAAADLAAIIDQIVTPPVHLLGYSMGGRLALYFACHYPHYVSKLILESASPGLKTEQERSERRLHDEALADFIEHQGIAAFVNRWQQLPLWESQKQLPASVRQALRRQRLSNHPTGLAHSLRGLGTGVQPSLWPHLSQVTTPTLLLCGELDAKFVAINREMAAAMPQARLEIISQAGHTVHLERPSAFQQVCLQFLLPYQ
ncbi:MAG: 2-succinyl-6-hydroxy-2,4-cyclohexadiene-1-carboxylate synthase [Chloroflexota bacterium]